MPDKTPDTGNGKEPLIKPERIVRRGRPDVRRRRRPATGNRGRIIFYGLPALAFVLILTLFIVAVASSKQVEVALEEYGDLDAPVGLIDRDHPIPLETEADPVDADQTGPAPTIVLIEPEDPSETTPEIEDPGEVSYPRLYVISESAGIYAAPDSASDLLATVRESDILFQTADADEWIPVRHKSIEGFIHSKDVSDVPHFVPRTGETYYIQNRQVYVREGPGTNYPIEGFGLRGMTILVLEAGEEWSNIRTEHGLRGYMHNDLFGPDKPADEITELETGRYKYVDTEVANLREEPSTDSETIGAAFMDDRLYQISDNGGWSKVRTEGGVIAYVFNHLLRDTPPANPFVKTNRTLYVASDQVNVRSSPTTDSDIIDRVKINQAVTELEANDTWSKIKLDNNKTGFIRSDLLTNIKPPPEGFTKSSGSVYVSTGAANIRSEPNTSCAIVIVVRLGEQLTSLATGPDWTMIRTSGGKTGYISNDLISKTKPSSGSSSSSSSSSGGSSSGSSGSSQTGSSGSAANSDSRQRVVDIAKSALGVPYRMSGRSMSAFDCSGLVKYTYEAIGYKNIPHGSDPQARQLGTKVSISGRDFSNLLPGDLLFFSRGSGYHHVGIYIGDNKMIHASSANGGVITTDLMKYPAPARVNRVLD